MSTLLDVNASTPNNQDVLRYNSSTSKWVSTSSGPYIFEEAYLYQRSATDAAICPITTVPGTNIVDLAGNAIGRTAFINYLFDNALIWVVDTSAGKIQKINDTTLQINDSG